MNDIGESLQSEELQGARGRQKKREMRRISCQCKEKKRPSVPVTAHSRTCKPSVRSCTNTHVTPIKVVHTVCVCLFLPHRATPPPMTHRAGYVRAGRPLAVGPRHSGASDFLLLPQQLAVLLLSVLHVDEQRDEAVLHLCARAQKKKPYYIIMITLELQLSIIL